MNSDEEIENFFGEDDLFGDTDAVGADEAIEDNRYDGGGGGGKDEISDFLKKEKKATTARKKTNPRALLNERLLVTGDVGLKALKESFANYKPNVKADPYSNLPELLKKYQHWAHVLAPRLKFEDVIARCEQLGEKRPVKLYMGSIRLGMTATEEDFAVNTRKRRNSGDDGIITTEYASDKDNSDRERSPSPPPRTKIIDSPKNIDPPKAPRSMFGSVSATPAIVVPVVPVNTTPLTEEQRRKIAENRLRAMELRAKREAEERERLEREKREEEERDAAAAEAAMEEPDPEDVPSFDEDEIMAQFDDFE
ncbi:hypothetical protein PFISCL1PPCAC_19497 [Pristionchus fissidentatus]|uniref:TIMELESS-interacting protein n=1 Tax=Pristionchus fissidentatus TaxID=1538716 RepID=A0AAV5WCQ7_9BILA|nr:hypothetical protein PFISCL1PPCAC_19497 [Pristionchus fissidentatus]